MQIDAQLLSRNLEQRESGIWFSRHTAPVSYPACGHALCLGLEDGSFWFRHRNRCIVSVARQFPPGGIFFDIGGGNGYVARGLSDAGISCVLVEPGIDGALAARARGLDPVICARLEDLELPPASVDSAGMFDVLEHIENEAAALCQVHALLKGGGRLFLTVPAYQFLTSHEDRASGHFRRYTVAGLRRALGRCGFKVEFGSYVFSPLPPAVLLLRALPSRLGVRRGIDPQREAAEHAPGGIAERVVERLLDVEYRRLEQGRSLPFGTSCLCVAAKV